VIGGLAMVALASSIASPSLFGCFLLEVREVSARSSYRPKKAFSHYTHTDTARVYFQQIRLSSFTGKSIRTTCVVNSRLNFVRGQGQILFLSTSIVNQQNDRYS
jgi:hypothetical protein